MCAQNGRPSCGCSHNGEPNANAASGSNAAGVPDTGDVDGVPRFLEQITMAAPLKAEVSGGYLVPASQQGQMMIPANGGTIALYQDIYGADANGYLVYPGAWGAEFSAGRP
jgi:hypothetical protein